LGDFFFGFKVDISREHTRPWEMSQINRHLVCTKIWPAEKVRESDVRCRPSRTIETEARRVHVVRTNNPTERGVEAVRAHDDARGAHRGVGHSSAQLRNRAMESRVTCAHPARGSISSDTAQELCNAVSVSMGLTVDSHDTSDPDPNLVQCLPVANEQHVRGEYLFGVTLNGPGAQTPPHTRCANTDDLHSDDQLVEMFKTPEDESSVHHMLGVRSPLDGPHGDFDGITSKDMDHIDTAGQPGSYPYGAPHVAANFTHFPHLGPPATERQAHAYEPPGQGSQVGDSAEEKYVDYLQEQYSVKIKSEAINSESTVTLWGTHYNYSGSNGGPYPGSRQCVNAHNLGTCSNSTLVCDPYERGVVRRERPGPEQWYPAGMLERPPYPTPGYIKNEAGGWLDTSYNDTR